MEVNATKIIVVCISREEDESLKIPGLDNTVVRRGILAPPFVFNLWRTNTAFVVVDFFFFLRFEIKHGCGWWKEKT
jgi:hypothetical protein